MEQEIKGSTRIDNVFDRSFKFLVDEPVEPSRGVVQALGRLAPGDR